jgi:hypothetical protein
MKNPNFAFIAEGQTDIAVLENILVGYFDNPDLDMTRLQPVTNNESAGWSRVVNYIGSGKFKENVANKNIDFVIIQIDTDRLGAVVDITGDAQTTILNVLIFLKTSIGEAVYAELAHKIIFAIAVDAIECWLLPLHYTNNDKKDVDTRNSTHKCLHYLQQKIKIVKKYESYDSHSRGFMRQKTLFEVYPQNPSLHVFVENLERQIL